MAIVALLVLVSSIARNSIDDARAVRAAWGETTSVVVASAAVEAGAPIRTARPAVVDLPDALVVADALTALPAPEDRLRWSLRPGEVVTGRHLSSGARGLAPNERAIAVPTGMHTPPLSPGDVVDIVLVGDLFVTDGGSAPAESVSARVLDPGLDLDDGAVTVAVHFDDIGALARTLARGEAVIAVR